MPTLRIIFQALRLCLAVVLLLAFADGATGSPDARIVFGSGDGVYTANLGGNDVRRIFFLGPASDVEVYENPAWSRSTGAIAFTACGVASRACDLVVARPDLETSRKISDFGFQPSWAPDGERLAFAASAAGELATIAIADLETRRIRSLTKRKRGRFDSWPAWSPDGRQVAFTRQAGGNSVPVLYLVGLHGGGLRMLTKGSSPSWSPDGRRLLFAWGDGIYRIDVDGSHRTRLARVGSRGANIQPRWSPDGRLILYRANGRSGDDPSVWLMNADGSARRRILDRQVAGSGWQLG